MKATPELKKLIDELGPIEAELGRIEADYGIAGKKKRAEALRKAINARIEAKPEEQLKLDGTAYVALVSEKHTETSVDIPGVFKFLGKNAFLKSCGFTITKLKELVRDEAQRDAFLTTERTGSRTVTTYKVAA